VTEGAGGGEGAEYKRRAKKQACPVEMRKAGEGKELVEFKEAPNLGARHQKPESGFVALEEDGAAKPPEHEGAQGAGEEGLKGGTHARRERLDKERGKSNTDPR
jgi:hypothetical protein